MLCGCGCGRDAGVYPRTQRGHRKGEERPYLRGHWNHRRRRDDLPPPNPSGLCMCGCERETSIAHQTDQTAGTVIGQHKRYWRDHGGRATWRTRITDDLWTEEDRGYETPCWIWQGRSLNQVGHGKITMQRRVTGAHRAMYEAFHGTIPEGLVLDHLCKQPGCIRPNHVEPVTVAENTRRSRAAKLTYETVALIRESQRGAIDLSRELGISRQTIYDIRWGKSWTAQ